MAVGGNPNIQVIKQRDTEVPAHLDFAFLREKGLEHIGKFSGRIWTDHNTHDPGITILEALCYAILDLGYRTQLPIEDLLAQESDDDQDNNFYTPAQILTCNPVTIVDYRKLLMEIDKVRNAWLEPSRDAVFYFDKKKNCFCKPMEDGLPVGQEDCFQKIELNGLYHVYIEMEQVVLPDKPEDVKAEIQLAVKEVLSAHRNLCEDFEDITILCAQDLGICADVEIYPGENQNEIYAEIIRRLRDFVTPSVKFYSLQTMLEKGKTMEEIYAGRPLLPNTDPATMAQADFRSFGFIDTDELEQIPRRRELHLSDLYTVIHEVPGVKTVKNLCLKNLESPPLKCQEDLDKCHTEGFDWRFHLQENHLAALNIDDITINLSSSGSALSVNAPKIKQEISSYRKSRLGDPFLDSKPPIGLYRDDLADYNSIQNEFPRVYGIGETGLPENASLLRKAQAFQLQAYLLFFDRLLADYLNQLGNFRENFSLERESLRDAAQKHSYFSKPFAPKSVPGMDDLIRFNAGKNKGIQEGIAFVFPVGVAQLNAALCEIEAQFNMTLTIKPFNDCIPTTKDNSVDIPQKAYKYSAQRDADIEQILRDLGSNNFELDIRLDLTGYYFILWPASTPNIALVSGLHFTTKKEALEAANLGVFLGAGEDNWTKHNNQIAFPDRYSMDLTNRTIDYAAFLSNLAEGHDAYLDRRELFLEHLLSRFSEKFTDYAAITYQLSAIELERRERSIEDKSNFLSVYDEISRNRGKAFDYLKPSWNTNNISGFEKRVSLLAGYGEGMQRSLCNIEIINKENFYRVALHDWRTGEKVLLESERPLPSESIAKEIALELRSTLKTAAEIIPGYDKQGNTYNLVLWSSGVKFVYPNVEELTSFKIAQEKAQYIKSLFSISGTKENVEISKYEYKHELLDINGKVERQSEKVFETAGEADTKSATFIESIQAKAKSDKSAVGLALLELESGKHYLDTAPLMQRIVELPLQWYWETTGKKKIRENQLFGSKSEALQHFIDNTELGAVILPQAEAFFWKMDVAGKLSLFATQLFADDNKAITDWKLAREYGLDDKSYQFESKGKQVSQILLLNKAGAIIAKTGPVELTKDAAEKAVASFCASFVKKRYQPAIVKSGKSWSFRFADAEDRSLLNSYQAYSSERAALEALIDTYSSNTSLLDGGSPLNPEFIFILTDEKGLLVAENPEPYDEKKDRDKALKDVLQALNKLPLPVTVRSEPRTYSFQLAAQQGDLTIVGTEPYPSSSYATAASLTLLKGLVYPSKLHIDAGDRGEAQVTHEGVTARLDKTNAKDAPFALERFASTLQPLVYSLNIKQQAKFWRFVHYWETDANAFTRVFRSVKEDFASADAAQTTYSIFLQNLKFYKRQGKIGNLPLFVIPRFEDAAFTLYEGTTPLPEASLIDSYLAFYQTLDAPIRDVPDPWVIENEVRNQNCYQLIKKGNPFAYYRSWLDRCKPKVYAKPCDNGSEENHIKKLNVGEPCLDEYVEIGQYLDVNGNWLPNPPVGKPGHKELLDCYFAHKEEACAFRDRLCLRDPERYCWLDICVGLPVFVQLPTGDNGICKYHFIVRGSIIGKLAQTNLLTSIQGYDTAALATEAYEKQLWGLIEIASDPANYGTKICVTDCLNIKADDCGRTGEFMAAMHPDFMPTASLADRIVAMAVYFKSFPIRFKKENNKFYFQLYSFDLLLHDLNIIPDWTSWLCYDTYEDAFNAFCQLLDLLKNPTNCRVVCRGGKYRIELVEVLMVSTLNYTNEDQAWGRACDNTPVLGEEYCLPNSDCLCTPKDDLCKGYGAELFLKAAQCENAFVPYENSQASPTTYGYYVVDECYHVFTNPCCYETEKEATEAMIQFNEALNDYRTSGESLVVRAKLIREEVYIPTINYEFIPEMVSPDPCDCEGEDDAPFICPTIFELDIVFSDKTDALDAAKRSLDQIVKCSYVTRIVKKTPCGPYTFELVDLCCVLAKSSVEFGTASKRDDAMRRALECIRTEGMHLTEHILLRRALLNDKLPDCVDRKVIENPNRNASAVIIQPPHCPDECWLKGCPDCACELCWVDDPFEKDPCVRKDNPPVPYLPFADAYSFWATLVLPSWLKRFKTASARDLFEHLLYREAPSHVALNILWLSPREMCEFEACYRYWLAQKTCTPDASYSQLVQCKGQAGKSCCCELPDLCGQDASRVDPDCTLVKALKCLKADPFCDDDKVDSLRCECGPDARHYSNEDLRKDLFSEFNILNCQNEPCYCKDPEPPHDDPKHEDPNIGIAAPTATKVLETPQLVKTTAEITAPATPIKTPNGDYKKRMQDRIDDLNALENALANTKYFAQAVFFVEKEAPFVEYKKLIKAISAETQDFKGNENPAALTVAFATAHLLDKALEKPETAFAAENLVAVLKPLQEKGLSPALLSEKWKSEHLKGIFEQKNINKYETLLKLK